MDQNYTGSTMTEEASWLPGKEREREKREESARWVKERESGCILDQMKI